MANSKEKKTAFITGASRGIGKGIALRLAKAGYDIAFTHYNELDEAKSLQAQIHAMNQECFYYQASLEEKDVAQKVTKQAIKDLGELHVLVCNAGKTKFSSIKNVDPETIDFLYHLNYRSYLLCTQVASNHMIEKNLKGRIIFISSTRGIRAYDNDVIYGSLKSALNRAVESVAIELAKYDITINAVAPGATATNGEYSDEALRKGHFSQLVPLKRRGKPGDVAGLINYLISDEGSYITGETIKVDGGLILYGPDESPKER